MPTIPYQLNIPASGNSPSSDQPDMQANTNAINTWTGIDHYNFSNTNAGQHAQVNLPANGTAGSPAGLASVIYSTPGTADNSTSQLYFKNATAAYPLSCIKAYAIIDSTGAVVQGFGITGSTYSSGQYTVNLSPSLPSSNYAVFALAQFGSGYFQNYAISGVSSFVLYNSNTSTRVGFCVLVVQI